MAKNKVNVMTKKLQNLIKERKTPVVVTKQGSVKHKTKAPGSASVESYCYSSYNT